MNKPVFLDLNAIYVQAQEDAQKHGRKVAIYNVVRSMREMGVLCAPSSPQDTGVSKVLNYKLWGKGSIEWGTHKAGTVGTSYGTIAKQASLESNVDLWWHPKTGIARGCSPFILCGLAPAPFLSLTVFDVDVKVGAPEGAAMDKVLALEELLGIDMELGKRPLVKSKRSGLHVYILNTRGELKTESVVAKNIDIRSGTFKGAKYESASHVVFDPLRGYVPTQNGHLFVAPPELSKKMSVSGGSDIVETGGSVARNKKWSNLADMLASDLIVKIPCGERNATLYGMGCHWIGGGETPEDTEALMRLLAKDNFEEPYDEQRLSKCIASVLASRGAKDAAITAVNRRHQSALLKELMDGLQATKDGYKPSRANLIDILDSDYFREMSGGNIVFDTFYQQNTINGFLVDDDYITETAGKFSRHLYIEFGDDMMRKHVSSAGRHNRANSFKDWLDELPEWDGVDRIPKVVSQMVEPNDPNMDLYRKMVANTLLGPIFRAHSPEMVRHVLTLSGPQDIGKSKVIQAVCPTLTNQLRPAFNDSMQLLALNTSNGQRDLVMQIAGCVFAEIAELSGLKHTSIEGLKAFVSITNPNYVMKYKTFSMAVDAVGCLIATVNPDGNTGFLKDRSGNTRWWVVPVSPNMKIDLAWFDTNREQIWAQQFARYNKGEKHWFERDTEEYARIQRLNETFIETYGTAEFLVSAAKDREEAFAEDYITDDLIKEWWNMQNNGDYFTHPAMVNAMTKAGWVRMSAKGSTTAKANFTARPADVEEFGKVNGKPVVDGIKVRLPLGWAHPTETKSTTATATELARGMARWMKETNYGEVC